MFFFQFVFLFFKTNYTGPFNRLNRDCLQHILSFESPLEIWAHRTTSLIWKDAATVSLSQVLHVECSAGHCNPRLLVDICPNLETFHLCMNCEEDCVRDYDSGSDLGFEVTKASFLFTHQDHNRSYFWVCIAD